MKERFRKVRDLFEASREVPAEQRSQWLRESCNGDLDLEREVSALIEADQQSAFIDTSVLPQAEQHWQRLGPYEILEEIGHGGMGTVYRAVRADDAFRKVVAVKVIDSGGLRPGMAARFQKERQILARLEHPNIARILDGGSERGTPYLVMEYVEGERIDAYCDSRRLGIPERLALFSQLCDAVDYAHRNLIVHRDIKPGNVLVTADGTVKLLDFGIAKMLDPTDESNPTQTLQMTPDYASPEQIRGEAVTPASDVYAIGVMLFQLLTAGARPRRTTGISLAELIQAVSEEEPPPPSSKAPEPWRQQLRGDLDCIVLAALAREPERRYPSAGRLGDDLQRFREGLPVWAHADSASYRARKFMRRHWVLLSATAMVMVTLILGVVITSRQVRIAQLEKQAADKARSGEQHQRERAEQALAQTQSAQQRAVREAAEATRQRAMAEQRYKDVRSLATTVLFDIHDQIRGLAGAAEARRIAVSKALQYLDALSQQSPDDSGLQAELAAAYERAGDILGNFADSAVEGAQSSLPLYRKALELRKEVAKHNPADGSSRQALARAHERVGVGHLGLAQSAQALESFETAMHLNSEDALFRAEILDRLATAHGLLGSFDRALKYCREALALIEARPSSVPPVPDKLNARLARTYGMFLRVAGHNQESIPLLKKASELLIKLMAEQPDDVNYRRSYAVMLPQLARAYEATNRQAEADKVWTDARSRLAPMASSSVDPQIVLTLAYALKRIAWNHYHANQAGKNSETGEAEMAQSLEHSGRLAARPKAGVAEMTEYADTLLKAPFPKLQNHKQAFEFAMRANELSRFQSPMVLDTLAWAYYRNGDASNAIRTMEKALALLPAAEASGDLRKEFETALQEFRGSAPK